MNTNHDLPGMDIEEFISAHTRHTSFLAQFSRNTITKTRDGAFVLLSAYAPPRTFSGGSADLKPVFGLDLTLSFQRCSQPEPTTLLEFTTAYFRFLRLSLIFGDRFTEFCEFFDDVAGWVNAGYATSAIVTYFDNFRRKHGATRKFTDMDHSLFAAVTSTQTVAFARPHPPPEHAQPSRKASKAFAADSPAATPAPGASARDNHLAARQKGFCGKFQSGKCTAALNSDGSHTIVTHDGSSVQARHRCSICESPAHGANRCTTHQ